MFGSRWRSCSYCRFRLTQDSYKPGCFPNFKHFISSGKKTRLQGFPGIPQQGASVIFAYTTEEKGTSWKICPQNCCAHAPCSFTARLFCRSLRKWLDEPVPRQVKTQTKTRKLNLHLSRRRGVQTWTRNRFSGRGPLAH